MVEAEYIVWVDISNERSDQLTLILFLERLDEKLPKKFETIVADIGYESEENYLYLEEHECTCNIKMLKSSNMKMHNYLMIICFLVGSFHKHLFFYTMA